METIKGDMEAEIANGKKQDKENQARQDQFVADSFCVSTISNDVKRSFDFGVYGSKSKPIASKQHSSIADMLNKVLGGLLKWGVPPNHSISSGIFHDRRSSIF